MLWVALAVQFETRVALQANLGAASIAATMGRLLAVSSIAGLAVQVLLTRPILERWGTGAALAVLPLALAGLLGAYAALPVLPVIAGAYVADRVLRQTLHRSGESCLVSALPTASRAFYLMALGGVFTPILKAAASLAILALATHPEWVHRSALLVAVGLSLLCLRWRALYVRALRQTIEEGSIDSPGPALLDAPRLEVLLDTIDHGSPRSRRLALEWLRPRRDEVVRRAMWERTTSPDEAVRVLALRWVSGGPLPDGERARLAARWRGEGLSDIERIAVAQAAGSAACSLFGAELRAWAAGRPSSLRTAAMRLLWASTDEADREEARRSASGLLASRSADDRGLGLRLSEEARDARVLPDALPLAADPDPGVRNAAIACLGRLPGPEARSVVWAALEETSTASAAAMAIASRGEEALAEIDLELRSPMLRPAVRAHLLRALGRIASPSSVPRLLESLDGALRIEALRALNRIHAAYEGTDADPERVRSFATRELSRGLVLLRAWEALRSHIHARGLLARELTSQIEEAREAVSRALGLLTPPGTMARVYRAVRASAAPHGGHARELLRTLFQQGPLRDGTLRLLDDRAEWTAEHERPPLEARQFPSPRAAMGWIATGGDRRLRSAARLDPQARELLEVSRTEDDPMEPMLDTILFLTDVSLFEELTDAQLLEVARLAEPVEAAAGEAVFRAGEPSDGLFIVRQGKVVVKVQGREMARLGPGECVGEMGVLAGVDRSALVEAAERCRLLRFDAEEFLGLLNAHPEIGRGLLRTIVRRLSRATGGSDSVCTMVGMIGGPEEPPSIART